MDTESALPILNASQTGRAKRILAELENSGKLTNAGLRWLELALDPFHDNVVKGFEGIPDQNTGMSVCCSVVQEMEIVKPGTLPPGNWKVRICTFPIVGEVAVNSGSNQRIRSSTIVDLAPDNTSVGTLYAVSIDMVADGVDFPDYPVAGTVGLQLPDTFTRGPFKVAALGIETVNTTSEIYRQGLCTSARMNQAATSSFATTVYKNATGTASFVTSHFPVRTPPKNLSEMNLLPGTCAWHAEEGAYSVVTLKEIGTVPALITPTYPLLMVDDMSAGPNADYFVCLPMNGSTIMVGMSAGTWRPSQTVGVVPSDMSIQMFTGLSSETSLTVRARWVIERFPSDIESEIVVMATPTASFDPLAIQIYNQMVAKLPPAVKFSENPAGEWFTRVLGGIADFALPILEMIPHPIAKGLSLAAKGMQNWAAETDHQRALQSWEGPPRKKKQKPKIPRQQQPAAPAIQAPQKKANAGRTAQQDRGRTPGRGRRSKA